MQKTTELKHRYEILSIRMDAFTTSAPLWKKAQVADELRAIRKQIAGY